MTTKNAMLDPSAFVPPETHAEDVHHLLAALTDEAPRLHPSMSGPLPFPARSCTTRSAAKAPLLIIGQSGEGDANTFVRDSPRRS